MYRLRIGLTIYNNSTIFDVNPTSIRLNLFVYIHSTSLDLKSTEISINHQLFRCTEVALSGCVLFTHATSNDFMVIVRFSKQKLGICSMIPIVEKRHSGFKCLLYMCLGPT